jgi:hypothetical protein
LKMREEPERIAATIQAERGTRKLGYANTGFNYWHQYSGSLNRAPMLRRGSCRKWNSDAVPAED